MSSDTDSEKQLLVADALQTILQATESSWPVHSGGPPEHLVAALQVGHAALTRIRSVTPPCRSPHLLLRLRQRF